VVVSARAQEGRNEVNGGAFGVIDWLDKPVNQDRLTSAINEAVQQHIHGRLRILHIEDDPDVVQFVAMVLQPIADVQAAMTLQAARQWLTRGPFDLILLDIGLPDGSGLELLTCLNQQPTPPTPIVIFSAQEVDMETARQVAAVLIKSRTSNERLRNTIVSLAPLTLADQNELVIPGME
jgi:DNA-binding response OmpR family regulator